MTQESYEFAIAVCEKTISDLYEKLAYSEKRRRSHFAELELVKKEKKIVARRLGKKRRNIRLAKKYLL